MNRCYSLRTTYLIFEAFSNSISTSRFFVVQLQIFCRGQIGLKFVGPSACRTLADFFVATNRVEAWGRVIQIKMAPLQRKLKHALFTRLFHFSSNFPPCFFLHASVVRQCDVELTWHCQAATSLSSFTGVHCSISALISAFDLRHVGKKRLFT